MQFTPGIERRQESLREQGNKKPLPLVAVYADQGWKGLEIHLTKHF
jgi:hypothetical protein